MSVSPPHARPLQLIYVAAASAVIVFFALLLVLASSGAGDGDGDSSGQQSMWAAVLSIVHFMFAMGVYGFVPMLFRRMTASGSSQGEVHGNPPLPLESSNSALPHLHKALIVRLAMMESVALFGLTVFLVTITTGMLKTESRYWLNLTTGVVFVGFLAATFPTTERLTQALQSTVPGSSG